MAVIRLDSDERRKAIVRAAVPLFARKGFAGTTTRELAEAAGISEALLFKHFPSKQLLYREIRQLGCEGDPGPRKARHACRPRPRRSSGCSASWCAISSAPRESERGELDSRLRLVAHSFLEDGEYARELFEAVSERVLPLFEASYEAAVAAGDIYDPGSRRGGRATCSGSRSTSRRCWRWPDLPGRNCVPCDGTLDELVDEATAFILRGIGMRDNAIAADAGRERDAAAD